jgi:hypothetical protein
LQVNLYQKNNKTERLQDILDNPFRNCYLMLTFNHPKCEKVGNRIYNLIRPATPEFRLNIIWKTVSLSQILSSDLKAQVVNCRKIIWCTVFCALVLYHILVKHPEGSEQGNKTISNQKKYGYHPAYPDLRYVQVRVENFCWW